MDTDKIPNGYDNICEWCLSAYKFRTAKFSGVEEFARYCSTICEEHNGIHVTNRRRNSNRAVTIMLLELEREELVL